MKVYRSKISIGLVLFLLALFGLIGYDMRADFIDFLSLFLFLLPPFFIAYVFTSIRYSIGQSELHVQAGVLMNVRVPIASIVRIESTNSILSAPAASMDRLEVFYQSKSVVISPVRKAEFIADLLQINSAIDVSGVK